MKIKFGVFCLYLFISFKLYAKSWEQYPKSDSDLEKNSIIQSAIKLNTEQEKLALIKFYMINGNLLKARSLLQTTTFDNNLSKTIKLRYLAIISFILEEYETTIKILEDGNLQQFFNQNKTCQLKILSEIITKKNEEALQTWRTCKEASESYSQNDLFWLRTIIQLNQTESQGLTDQIFKQTTVENLNPNFLRLYLKLALYLNKQQLIIPRFKYFGNAPFEDVILRELIGLNYYRNGNLVQAYDVLNNLNTANAELFKGNLLLVQKLFEKAYAQFKLTLLRKSNSENALERLIPLSWKLGQYKDGIDYIQKVNADDDEKIKQLTLLALFLTNDKKNISALETIQNILKLTNKGEALEVSQLKYVNKFLLKQTDQILIPLHNACTQKDGLACWLLIADGSWESFLDYIQEERNFEDKLDIIDEYTTTVLPSFKEVELIEQKHIEELDEKMIKLTKQLKS